MSCRTVRWSALTDRIGQNNAVEQHSARDNDDNEAVVTTDYFIQLAQLCLSSRLIFVFDVYV